MSVWTNGEIHVVLGPRGLSTHRGDRVELILAQAQLGALPPRKQGKVEHARLRPLAVDGKAQTAFTSDGERNLIRASLTVGGPALKLPWQVAAIGQLDDERVLAIHIAGTKARALTSVVIGVPPIDPKGKWERELEADKPKKVDWPDNLLWEKAIWSRKTRWTTDFDLLELDTNAYGFALCDTDSAVVGLLRPKSEGFAAILRTPKDNGSTVAATATPEGVLVATAMSSLGRSVLSHFDEQGGRVRHREFEYASLGPLTLIGDAVICLLNQRELAILNLADLEDRARIPLPAALPPSQVVLRAAGSSFLLAAENVVYVGEQRDGDWTLRELDLAGVPEPGPKHQAEIPLAEVAPPEQLSSPAAKAHDQSLRIINQTPRLGLDPHQDNDAWHFKQGEEFEIEIKAVSVGGPAETGLFVEVDGDALHKRLVEFIEVSASGPHQATVKLEPKGKKLRAVLPEFLMPAGVEPPTDRKIKPHERFADNPVDTFLTVRLRGRALELGANVLLYVRVGFDRAENEGSLMRGRPLTISVEGPPPPPPPPEPEVEPEPEAAKDEVPA